MNLCIFEDDRVPSLRPLVETRAAFDLRLGLRTLLGTARATFSPDALILHTRPHVADITRLAHDSADVNVLPDAAVLFLNGRFVAAEGEARSDIERATSSEEARLFTQDDTLVAAWIPNVSARLPDDFLAQATLTADAFPDLPITELESAPLVEYPWDLLDTLRPALARDLRPLTETSSPSPLLERPHASVNESVTAVNSDRIVLGDGATIRPGAVLNAENGPIFIGGEAVVHEQAVVRGPCALGPKTHVKGGAQVEGTAAGRWCKLGGEVHDTIVQGFSNKGHAGFLGDAYLGCWCNLGADTNNSNLKNDYGEVSAYAPAEEQFVDTGRQFAGLFMGDHSKCGINTMFNTGTVIGTYCNLFGGDYLPRYVPPFSWGGPGNGFTEYRIDKALDVADRVMARRDRTLTDTHAALLRSLFDQTADERARHHS